MGKGHFWVIVLAASGDRGAASGSMLNWTVGRAERLVPKDRIVAVVEEGERSSWDQELSDLPGENIVVQPDDRGTAAGILLPLLSILRRDPAAKVLVMPSDHHMNDEAVLDEAILEAIQAAHRDESHVVLLGMAPDDLEREYGWIVPGDPLNGGPVRRVAVFVENPAGARARTLARNGALWNSLILVAGARVMLDLYASAAPSLLGELADSCGDRSLLDSVYRMLPASDFSRDVLEPSPDRLLVLPVARCDWSDLGNPGRLEQFRARKIALRPGAPAPLPRSSSQAKG